MPASGHDVDVLLIVPFEPLTAYAIDSTIRQTLGAHLGQPLVGAVAALEEYLGHSLNVLEWTDHPLLHGQGTGLRASRSLTAVTLATHLAKADVDWEAIDPGVKELGYWRRCFAARRSRQPRVVAISTTFISSVPWLKALCKLARRSLPRSRILLGGTFYLTSMRDFLSLDADIFCFGEGEIRLPQIAKSIRDRTPLDVIPGLCLRWDDGRLRYTGPVAPLDLNSLPAPDWSQADRIEPAVDFEQNPTFYCIETQRGCPFKCAFCTYRTLTCHQTACPKKAVQSIFDTAALPPGFLFLVDSTATSPHKRWEEILVELASRGGAPHPIVAFGRVSDITEPAAELMARAGVRGLVVGQESGDQQLLRAMRKGTKIEQVPSAVAALGKFGLGAQFAFIHGFPGETTESIRATRSMITMLNHGFESDPVVHCYNLTPFSMYDFASVAERRELQSVHHYLGYESSPFPPQRVGEEMLGTLVAGSRVPHAPLCSFLFNGLANFLFNIPSKHRRTDVFRWLKSFERGVAIFLERELEGKTPDNDELKRVREDVLVHCPPNSCWKRAWTRQVLRARMRSSRRFYSEWSKEKGRGPGVLTRAFAMVSTYRDLGRVGDALSAWKIGTYPVEANNSGLDDMAMERLTEELVKQAQPQARQGMGN